MKKLLAGAIALSLASYAIGSPAYAQDVRGSVTISIGDNGYQNNRYGYQNDYYGRQQYGYGQQYNNHGNRYGVTRHRDQNYLYWKYFASARSFYPGRCNPRREVVVRDPSTYRLVCLDRNSYDRYLYERRYNRFYR